MLITEYKVGGKSSSAIGSDKTNLNKEKDQANFEEYK